MYFFKKNGRQYVDCTGDLILTHNDAAIKARSKSAGPHKALNARYVIVPRLGNPVGVDQQNITRPDRDLLFHIAPA